MATSEQYCGLVEAVHARGVAVHIHHDVYAVDGEIYSPGWEATSRRRDVLEAEPRLEFGEVHHMTFAERFPRLTIAMIGFALVAFTVITEVDFLRGAGYHWY